MKRLFSRVFARNEKGSALVMTLVAAAIGVTISAALLGVIGNMNITENGARFRANADSFNEEIRALLSSPASCTNSLGGIIVSATSSTNVPALKDTGGGIVYQPGQVYMDRTLTLTKTVLDSFKRDGVLSQGTMALTEFIDATKPQNGSKSFPRAINVSVQLDASNKILSCIALSRMTDGIWRVSQIDTNNIYFPGTLPEGRVGIGTNDPVSLLEVQGNGTASALPNFPAIRVKNTNPNLSAYNSAINNMAAYQFHAGNGLVQGQLSAQAMVTPGGSIGTSGNISLWAKTYGTAMTFVTAHGNGGTQADYGEKMRIDYRGAVGIGTDTPGGILEIGANIASDNTLPTLLLPNERQQPVNPGIWFKNAGGTPDARIYEGQGGYLNISMGSGGGIKFLTSSNFASWIDRNGNYAASDRRLKKDIQPIGGVLEKLAKISAVTYLWRDEELSNASLHIGLIAQDLQKEFPELVVEVENPNKKSLLRDILTVDYGHLTAIVLQAVNELHAVWSGDSQELHAQVEALREENASLKRRLDAIEHKLQ